MEKHLTRRCDMGTINYSLEISTAPALRTRLFLKGEGMLGSKFNPFIKVIIPRGQARFMINYFKK